MSNDKNIKAPYLNGSARLHPDDKGRIAIPSRLRESLSVASNLVLTLHPHGCLSLYTEQQFRQVEQQITATGNMGYFDSHLEEIIVGCAESTALDSAGRITISSHLRERADIGRDVLLFALANSIRLWNKDKWEQRNTLLTARLQDEEVSVPWKNMRI